MIILSITAYVTTRKIGGSLVVTLPKDIVNLIDIHVNETIKIDIDKTRPDFFGKCKGIGKFTEKDRLESRV